MAERSILEKARITNLLWPSIASALQTFLIRRDVAADGYERIWRLIHVWESTYLSLASAAITRLGHENTQSNIFRECREYFHGKRWDPVDNRLKTVQGAFAGSIDSWLEILKVIARKDSLPELPGTYLKTLHNFLNNEGMYLGDFVLVWQRACDVTETAKVAKHSVKDAFREINSFRNRFAHVPFPHDPICDIAIELEALTEQLFGIIQFISEENEEQPKKPLASWQQGGALTGGLKRGKNYLKGTVYDINPDHVLPLTFSYFPNKKEEEAWPAEPFVYLDEMLRPHILTRVNTELASFEYTRFQAEANAVLTVYEKSEWLEKIPIPNDAEYLSQNLKSETSDTKDDITTSLQEKDDLDNRSSVDSLDEAINALRREEYDRAIPYLNNYARQHPDYHIAWLRLGLAKRQKAMRVKDEDQSEATKLLQEAIDDLTKATNHNYPEYKAQSTYERSKARYWQFTLTNVPRHFDKSVRDAKDAINLFTEDRFISWLQYLERKAQEMKI